MQRAMRSDAINRCHQTFMNEKYKEDCQMAIALECVKSVFNIVVWYYCDASLTLSALTT